jgi:hypothetical protein
MSEQPVYRGAARPETDAAHLVRVGFAGDGVRQAGNSANRDLSASEGVKSRIQDAEPSNVL